MKINRDREIQYLADLQKQHDVKLDIPEDTSSPEYIELICQQFSLKTAASSGLATCMTAIAIFDVDDSGKPTSLIELSQRLIVLRSRDRSNTCLEMTLEELRSFLFWFYLKHEFSDPKVLDTVSIIGASLLRVSKKKMKWLDATLTHGLSYFNSK